MNIIPPRATIASAPKALNLNDQAMWVLGWNECLDALAAPTPLLTLTQQQHLLRNPEAIKMLMDIEDCGYSEAVSMVEPGELEAWPTKRWAALKELGRSIVAEDPELWPNSVLRTFGFPVAEAAPAPQPAVPKKKPLPDLMMAAYHEAIGWNAYVDAMNVAAAPKAAPAELPDAVAHYGGVFTDEQLGMKPALQQGEYLPLPEPAIKACHCYSTNQVREAIDADRAARGAAQAAPAEIDAKSFQSYAETRAYSKGYYAGKKAAQAAPADVAEDAEDGARFRAMVSAAFTGFEAFERVMYAASETEPETIDDFRALVDKARAQAAQPEGDA